MSDLEELIAAVAQASRDTEASRVEWHRAGQAHEASIRRYQKAQEALDRAVVAAVKAAQ